MNTAPDDPKLTAYALGELPASEIPEVEQQLADSLDARREVDETKALAALLSDALAREAQNTPLPEIESIASPTVANEGPAESDTSAAPDGKLVAFPKSPAHRRTWIGLAAAAVALLLSIAGWWLMPTSPQAPDVLASVRLPDPPTESPPIPVPAEPVPVTPSAPPPVSSVPAGPPSTPRDSQATPAPASLSSPESMTQRRNPALSKSSAESTPAQVATSPSIVSVSTSASDPASLPTATTQRLGRSANAPTASSSPTTAPILTPAFRTRYGLRPPADGLSTRVQSDQRAESIDASAGRTDPYERARGLALERRNLLARSPASDLGAHAGAETPRLPVSQNPGYTDIVDHGFVSPLSQPLSTFGLDVDTGSYANVRRFLNAGTFPPRAAVRVEEMINYFNYEYAAPRGDDVFGIQTDVAACPWEPNHRLVRIALKAKEVAPTSTAANLVFLVDVSGSMQPEDRLPLIRQALRALVKRLSAADRVAIVTYASSAGIRLPSTSAEEKDRILEAIDTLHAGGSTHGEGGIRQAYDVARQHFVPGGVNRLLLLTDGDFNVGISDQSQLFTLIREQARSGVFLTTLGVGTDNFKDALMRGLADHGNGSYHFLDSFEEAQRVLLEQRNATFVTVARDAKAQVEFNPATVGAWRLIGYEKRQLAAQDFNDDSKDAGEIGAGQCVTVLYEIVPVGQRIPGNVDALKYQPAAESKSVAPTTGSTDLLTLKLRYQRPEVSASVLREVAVQGKERELTGDFRFAAAVAAFAKALRDPNRNDGRGFDTALELAQSSLGQDPGGWRAEFLTLVRKARGLAIPGTADVRPSPR